MAIPSRQKDSPVRSGWRRHRDPWLKEDLRNALIHTGSHVMSSSLFAARAGPGMHRVVLTAARNFGRPLRAHTRPQTRGSALELVDGDFSAQRLPKKEETACGQP